MMTYEHTIRTLNSTDETDGFQKTKQKMKKYFVKKTTIKQRYMSEISKSILWSGRDGQIIFLSKMFPIRNQITII